MPKAKTESKTGNLMVNVFDGARQPFAKTKKLLIRVIDGNQRCWREDFYRGPSVAFKGLPAFDNFADNYTVIVSADKCLDAGFTPVKISRNSWQHVDLMVFPKESNFNFSQARWETLKATHPELIRLLTQGAASDVAARDRYDDLKENRLFTLAAFFNIATALCAIQLPVGTAFDYLKVMVWEEMTQDRFFSYADAALIDQVGRTEAQGLFAPEFGSGLLHPGATRSFKQIQFGEANVQVTFHEADTKTIDGAKCVKVETDIDYYRDVGAHALLEVLPNTVFKRLTDPRQVYVLRWIAGRHAGVPEFNPPYTLV